MVELYPHQKKAVNEMHNGCILVGDVGLGKSLTAAAYYMEKEAPKDVIVITTAKKRDTLDWNSDFAKYGVGRTSEDSVAGCLTVDSWNNLGKYRDRRGAFFIFDEQRVVGSGKWTKDFIRIAQANRWILLSATPGDTWLDYIPVFVANGFYKNRSQFLQEHVVFSRYAKFPKVERYLGVGKLVRLRNSLLVNMPYERHTERLIDYVPVDYDEVAFKQVLEDRWHIYKARPLRDVAELFLVMRKVVNSSPTRLEAIRTLMSKHPRLIVFYNFDYELEELRSLANTTPKVKQSETTQEHEECPRPKSASKTSKTSLVSLSKNGSGNTSETCSADTVPNEPTPTPVFTGSSKGSMPRAWNTPDSASAATQLSTPNGLEKATGTATSTVTSGSGPVPVLAEWNGHKHDPVPSGDRWVYLVQYQAGAEGWNCITTNAMAFYSLTYSYKNWHQAFGRIDRLNTPYSKLYYYVLLSNSMIDKAIMKALMSKKSFNQSNWLSKIVTTHSQKRTPPD